jgi:hypothetical protein
VTLMGELNMRRYDAVNTYALTRLQSKGDVYGWAPLEGDAPLQALLLVSRNAPLESFPTEIRGVQIILEPTDPPQMYSQ